MMKGVAQFLLITVAGATISAYGGVALGDRGEAEAGTPVIVAESCEEPTRAS